MYIMRSWTILSDVAWHLPTRRTPCPAAGTVRPSGHRTFKCHAHALFVYIGRTKACTPKSPARKSVYTFAPSAVLDVHFSLR